MQAKKTTLVLTLIGVLSLSTVAGAISLPDPTDVYDGVPVTILYNDFYSYNLWLLDDLAAYAPYDAGTYKINGGVGNQDIVLYTQAGGTSNQNIGPGGGYNFEDPVNTNTGVADGEEFDGWWGQNDQNDDGTIVDVNGPVLVGDLLDYLNAFDPNNNIPVFLFDLNQTGAQKDLWAYGSVSIINPDTDVVIASWDLNNNNNPPYPPGTIPGDSGIDDPWVYVPGSYSIQGNTELFEEDYTGSGFDDYAFYAATMNLELYDPDYWFVVDFHFDWLNNGGEEFFLTGTFVPPDTPPIPEPSTILLLGLGLLGIVGMRFKKR